MKKKIDLHIPLSWEERRPYFLEQFLYVPSLYEGHEKEAKISWGALFQNDRSVAVEFCSGNGQWIGEKALAHPESNWVAVEKRFDRAKKIWRRAMRSKIQNLFVICAEAHLFCRFYAEPSGFSAIYINFPDPWPKLRHAKHRLIQPHFLETLQRVSKNEAAASFVSDDLPYVEQMVIALKQSPSWALEFPCPFYAETSMDYGDSFFKTLWEAKGRRIYHICSRVIK